MGSNSSRTRCTVQHNVNSFPSQFSPRLRSLPLLPPLRAPDSCSNVDNFYAVVLNVDLLLSRWPTHIPWSNSLASIWRGKKNVGWGEGEGMGLRWACNSELRDFGAVDQGIRRSSLRQADWGRVTVLRFGCLQVETGMKS